MLKYILETLPVGLVYAAITAVVMVLVPKVYAFVAAKVAEARAKVASKV